MGEGGRGRGKGGSVRNILNNIRIHMILIKLNSTQNSVEVIPILDLGKFANKLWPGWIHFGKSE